MGVEEGAVEVRNRIIHNFIYIIIILGGGGGDFGGYRGRGKYLGFLKIILIAFLY